VRAAALDCDVAVVGGGAAGIAAAVAAAERGARTVLVERAPALGGNISQALVHTICGLYAVDGETPRPVNPGFPQRFAAVLRRAGAAGEPLRAGRVWVLPTDPRKLAAAALALCEATPGLELLLGAEVVSARLARDGRAPQRLHARCAQGPDRQIAASLVVDTSGDANAADLAGAESESAEAGELQLPSFIFCLADVDTAALGELAGFGRMRVTRAVAEAARSGELPAACEALLLRPAAEPGQVFVTLNVARPAEGAYDPLDSASLAALRDAAQGAAERIVDFLRATRPAFEKCRVDHWPARLGVRESRRIHGREQVSGDDVRAGRRRPDEVALSSWPIELWQDHRRARFEVPAGACSIPLGALVSRSHPRLATAGRCLSGDREALGALRVIGTALASGEAAGVAAALAADTGVPLSELAPERVRDDILGRCRGDSG
jgi:hypothetical protein